MAALLSALAQLLRTIGFVLMVPGLFVYDAGDRLRDFAKKWRQR